MNDKIKELKDLLFELDSKHSVVTNKCVHKAKLLTKEEVAENRSNAYRYLEL
tara:strand:- start:348 stop:503 length:156 start_codon:yes stop_codon:yes gene_type:complete